MKKRTDSYIMTADPMSVSDMEQIKIIKKTVKAQNALAKRNYQYARMAAAYRCEPMPKKPTLYRVRLMPRGPRKASYENHLQNGGQRVWMGFNCYLPQKYAERFDVYVHEMRNYE